MFCSLFAGLHGKDSAREISILIRSTTSATVARIHLKPPENRRNSTCYKTAFKALNLTKFKFN